MVEKPRGGSMRVAIVNCFDTYGERVENLYQYFGSKGNKVTVLASDFRHFAKTRIDKCGDGQMLIHVPEYKKNLSVRRLRSHYIFAKRAVEQIQEMDPDIVYVLVPPNSVVKEFAGYKRQHPEKKLIFDLIDLWPETMPIPVSKTMFPFTVWKNLRDQHLKYADYVVTECDLYREVLTDVLDGGNCSTLYLARRQQEDRVLYVKRNTLDICYLGSINNIVDIEVICSVLDQLSESFEVIFHIIGKGESKSRLLERLLTVNVKVEDYGTVYEDEEKKKIFSGCDFGLNIMKPSVCVGLTMKSIDYFEAGMPIINNIKGDTYKLVETHNIGVNLDENGRIDPAKIRLLKEQMDDVRKRANAMYKSNFTYDAFCHKLDEIYGVVIGETCKRE